MLSYQYRKSHCGDKTVVRSSYLHNGISYTGKITSLYWISPPVVYKFSVILLMCKSYMLQDSASYAVVSSMLSLFPDMSGIHWLSDDGFMEHANNLHFRSDNINALFSNIFSKIKKIWKWKFSILERPRYMDIHILPISSVWSAQSIHN